MYTCTALHIGFTFFFFMNPLFKVLNYLLLLVSFITSYISDLITPPPPGLGQVLANVQLSHQVNVPYKYVLLIDLLLLFI